MPVLAMMEPKQEARVPGAAAALWESRTKETLATRQHANEGDEAAAEEEDFLLPDFLPVLTGTTVVDDDDEGGVNDDEVTMVRAAK